MLNKTRPETSRHTKTPMISYPRGAVLYTTLRPPFRIIHDLDIPPPLRTTYVMLLGQWEYIVQLYLWILR